MFIIHSLGTERDERTSVIILDQQYVCTSLFIIINQLEF